LWVILISNSISCNFIINSNYNYSSNHCHQQYPHIRLTGVIARPHLQLSA